MTACLQESLVQNRTLCQTELRLIIKAVTDKGNAFCRSASYTLYRPTVQSGINRCLYKLWGRLADEEAIGSIAEVGDRAAGF